MHKSVTDLVLYIAEQNTICGKLLAGKFLVNHKLKVEVTGKENLAYKLKSVHMPNTFWCICEYWQGNFW